MQVKAPKYGRILTACGYTLTSQRQAVLDVLAGNQEKHLSPEEIYQKVKKVNPGIGMATVYRSLQLFEKVGLVKHITLDDGSFKYQIKNPAEKNEHNHLICEICGEVIDIPDEHQEDHRQLYKENILTQKGFMVSSCRVQFFGICRRCLDELKK